MKILGIALGLLLASTAVSADMIEMGSVDEMHTKLEAAMSFSNKYSPRVLVSVEFHGLPEEGEPGVNYRLFWLEGQIGINPDPQNGGVPSYNLKVTPVKRLSGDEIARIGFWGPAASVSRDVDLGRRRIKIHALGLSISGDNSQTLNRNKLNGFISISLDAFGYAWAKNEVMDESHKMFSFGEFAVKAGGVLRLSGDQINGVFLKATGSVEFGGGVKDYHGDVFAELALVMREATTELSAFVRVGYLVDQVGTQNERAEGYHSSNDIRAAYLNTGVNVTW